MIKLSDYIFFRLYRFYYRMKNSPDGYIMAAGVLSLIQFLTFINVMFIVRAFYKFEVPRSEIFIPLIIIIMIFNWFRYEKDFDIKELERLWSNVEKKKRIIHDTFIGIYLFVSALIPIIDAIIIRHLK